MDKKKLFFAVAALALFACGERDLQGDTGISSSSETPQTACSEWAITTPATCEAAGTETKTCSDGTSETRPIAQLGSAEWSVTSPATCEFGGIETKNACDGNAQHETRNLPKLEWGDWLTTTPATCESSGIRVRTCPGNATPRQIELVAPGTDLVCNTSSSSETPSSSSVSEPSSSSSQLSSSSSEIVYTGLCEGFNPNETKLHYGKQKKQICDERDGTRYFYVDIGSQTWMAENLRYKGDENVEYRGSGNGKGMGRCPRNSEEDCEKYGRMYTLSEMFCRGNCEEIQWGVANPVDHSVNIACPIGWHLPTTTEAEELWTYSDPNFVPGSEGSGTGKNSAATKLKASSWQGGTDELGFSGLPGGYCGSGCPGASAGGTGSGSQSYWWSHGYGAPVPLAKSWRISQAGAGGTGIGGQSHTDATVDDAFQSYSTSAFYTRCLKDKPASAKTPEPKPQTLACAGTGKLGQRCYYGQWKGYVKDGRDGKEYPYVSIGGKLWMAANLNYNARGSVCYNNLEANCDVYGRLYNYRTAMDPNGEWPSGCKLGSSRTCPTTTADVCPAGWHVPSYQEWNALITDIGGRDGNAAKLKAGSGWGNSKSVNGIYGIDGTDNLGFAALPGGYGNLRSGNYGTIVDFGSARGGFWWSTTTSGANGAVIYHIGPTLENINMVDNDLSRMYSIRCVFND